MDERSGIEEERTRPVHGGVGADARVGDERETAAEAGAPAGARRLASQGDAPAGAPARDVHRPSLPPPIGERVATPHGTDRDGHPATGAEAMRVVDILSHELRSPITTIHLGTKVLREQGSRISRPVQIEVVEAVEEEAERLYRLVEDLLAVARHDGGAAELAVGPLLLQHWLPGVIAAEVHEYPRLAVRASLPPDLPPVLADDAALAHVMRNLLANVVRHAPDGMPAEVVGRPAEPGWVRIDVLDRGPGIDEREAERLFDPFYRSPSAVARGSAAGLGLAAARRLLRAMDGRIEARRRDGGGARFTIVLPVADADQDGDDGELADEREAPAA